MGLEGGAQGKPCPALAAPHGQGRRLRRLLHLQEHGAGAELSRQRPPIRPPRFKLQEPRPTTHQTHRAPPPPPTPSPLSNSAHRDEPLGPMMMRVASFFPFQTTYYLNGHSFIEQQLKRAQIGFRKTDKAILAVDDVAALQAAADRLSPAIIRGRL